jgi:hypothetical protein
MQVGVTSRIGLARPRRRPLSEKLGEIEEDIRNVAFLSSSISGFDHV